MYRINYNSTFLILIASSFLLLAACGKNEHTAGELIRYHNEDWTELAEKRDEVLSGHGSQLINIEEKEGKQASIDYMEEVILADYKNFIEEEKAIEIHDTSVEELHELLIDADEYFYYFLKKNGPAYYLGEADENDFLEATEETKDLFDKFFDYREKLMKRNDLAIDHVLSDKGSYEQIMMDKSEAKNVDTIIWGNH